MAATSTYNEQELLQMLSQNDSTAFEILYDIYWESLYNTAYKRLQHEEHCKDAVQDVFADLWTRRKELEIDNLGAYLHTAVRFQVLKLVNRHSTRNTYFDPFETVLISYMNADGKVREKELSRIITAWMEELPRKRREIFLLYFEQERTTKEIAAQLNISQKTVQNQLGTAMQSLQAHIAVHLLFIVSSGI
ncbi:RNA polymerase sigma factor [Chitinophaga sp. XS-30]|uniref:RNA polymerase sigma factor n=1 Tax=Chitinophaga sp. XS-30 TaxID=2604421 RepID=UPI0011DC8D26|nr:sigma-70 family RNA polymerase sigma factor [Chitinophaga sp. XS-30]QEH42165.1 sigma-70 family RNA polymerase sigma factor [Chitinophaga sp. XS-30]